MHATTTSAGFDRLGPTMLGSAPQAGQGVARHGGAGHGAAPQAWQGRARLGEARQGIAGPARPGSARQGQASLARRGMARLGLAWSGTAGMARLGLAWQGVARQDTNREGESGVQMAPNFSPDKNMTNTKQMTAADAIREIAEIHGHVTPQLVVDAAKPKDSPLHNNFEWNNTKAAAEFRLIQAAHLIRKIKVTIEASEDHKVSVRQFVNVAPINDDEPTSGLYVTVQDAMEVTSYREQLLNQCRRDIVAFKTKYAALTEAASIIKAMDKLKP